MKMEVPFWCECRQKQTDVQKKLAKSTSKVTLDGIKRGRDIQKEVKELITWIDKQEVYNIHMVIEKLK